MKLALDTNLYVRAFRDPADAEKLRAFQEKNAPHMYLSSVVLHELEVGGSTTPVVQWVQRTVRPFVRSRRTITPSHAAWRTAGSAIARLAVEGRLDRRSMQRSLVNDFLIAATCRENGVTLVTDNLADFKLIDSVIPFDFAAPWP
ncbi:MAG TPA: type II toxin-antitoxin system VapC family toxin [Longimicrobium sp.]|jgi:predicted nucleic acid-binding protein